MIYSEHGVEMNADFWHASERVYASRVQLQWWATICSLQYADMSWDGQQEVRVILVCVFNFIIHSFNEMSLLLGKGAITKGEKYR